MLIYLTFSVRELVKQKQYRSMDAAVKACLMQVAQSCIILVFINLSVYSYLLYLSAYVSAPSLY